MRFPAPVLVPSRVRTAFRVPVRSVTALAGGGGARVLENPAAPRASGQEPEKRERDEDDAEQEHQREATASGGLSALASATGDGRRSDAPTATASSTTITARETNAGTL